MSDFKKNFFAVFERLITENDPYTDLSPNALKVLQYLLIKACKEEKWFVQEKIADMAKNIRLSPNTLMKGLDELQKVGILEKKPSATSRVALVYHLSQVEQINQAESSGSHRNTPQRCSLGS